MFYYDRVGSNISSGWTVQQWGLGRGRGADDRVAKGRAAARVGRRPRLTRSLIGEVAKSVQRGAFLHVAAEAAGVGRRTLFTWLERGRDLEVAADEGTTELDEQDLLYVELLHEVTVAHAQARLKAEAAVLRK